MNNNPHILVNRPEGCCLTDPNTKSGVDLLIWLWKSSTTESKPNPEPHGPDQILVVHFKAQAGPAKFDQFHCYNNTQHSQAAQKIDNVPRVSDLNATDKTPMTVMSLTFVLGVNGTECVWGLEGNWNELNRGCVCWCIGTHILSQDPSHFLVYKLTLKGVYTRINKPWKH